MHFSTLLLTALTAATSISAAPAPAPDASGSLHKRAAEVIYLSKCRSDVINGGSPVYNLEVEYYANTANSQNGEVPGSNDRSSTFFYENGTPMPTGTFTGATFNGIARARFPSGTDVWWNIENGAYNRAVGAYSGTVSNGFHSNWICYRDSLRQLYATNTGGAVPGYRICYAEFYCMH